ncbi:unnamed protein product [Ectocarpus sp. 12 AP-2014]
MYVRKKIVRGKLHTKNGRRPPITTRPKCSVTFARISRHRRKKIYRCRVLPQHATASIVHRSLGEQVLTQGKERLTAVSLSSYEHRYLLRTFVVVLTKLSEATRRRQTPNPYCPARLLLSSLRAHHVQRDVHAPRIIHLTYSYLQGSLQRYLASSSTTVMSTFCCPTQVSRVDAYNTSNAPAGVQIDLLLTSSILGRPFSQHATP